jgi:hypothetical protein
MSQQNFHANTPQIVVYVIRSHILHGGVGYTAELWPNQKLELNWTKQSSLGAMEDRAKGRFYAGGPIAMGDPTKGHQRAGGPPPCAP